MGYPILENGSLDYDQPAPTPQRLTDPAQGYGEPSEAAMAEARKHWIVRKNITAGKEEKAYAIAKILDAFAAQAVAAREAEIKREVLNAPSKLDDEGATYIRLKDIGEILNGQ